MFGNKAVKDALRRVTLLSGSLAILLQDLMNNRQKRIQLSLRTRLLELISWRFDILQDSLQSPPGNLVIPARLPLADFLVQYPTSNFDPFFHVLEHPIPRTYVSLLVRKPSQTYEISQGRYLILITRESPAQALAFSSAVHTMAVRFGVLLGKENAGGGGFFPVFGSCRFCSRTQNIRNRTRK